MNGEWSYINGYFTPDECDFIISQAEKITAFDGVIGDTGAIDNQWRRSTIRPILKDQNWQYLFDKVDQAVANINREWFNIAYDFLPGIQFASYNESNQGCYKRHQDVFLMSPTNTHRKLSFTVQLSDPTTYQGGELKFLDVAVHPNEENMRVRGTICVFPSIIFHEVTSVTKGIRHSLAGWYEGPRWR